MCKSHDFQGQKDQLTLCCPKRNDCACHYYQSYMNPS